MDEQLWSLEGLIEQVTSRVAGSELDRLAEAVRISDEIGSLSDELVGHFVEQARSAGRSWSEIGQQLGVSKQAAQQRFVSRPSSVEDRIRQAIEGAVRKSSKRIAKDLLESLGAGRGSRGGNMFESFTDRARHVLVLAQDEAGSFNHNYLGTEHILLGILGEPEGIGAKALEAMGVSLHTVREKIEEIVGAGSTPSPGPPPFTPRAKKVVELSFREALRLGHNYIGTEHLLLGLLREGEGVAGQILISMEVALDRAREEVLRLLGGERGAAAAE